MYPSTTAHSLGGALNGETLTGFVARRAGKGHEMRKYLTFRLSVHVTIDLAAILRIVVVAVYLLS